MGRLMWIIHLLALTMHMCTGLKWLDPEPKYKQTQLCSGQNIQLAWTYELHKEETLEQIVWSSTTHKHRSLMVMATFAKNNFVPMAEFSGRLRQVGNAGIELSCATAPEAGRYYVTVKIQKGDDSSAEFYREANVQVIDTPKTTSKELQLTQDAIPLYDRITGQYHIQLSCGHFSDRGEPPVHVNWKTPYEESVTASTGFLNGSFYLQLPNPPKGGNYSCGLSPLHEATTCLPRDSPLLGGASKVQDAIEMRFLLLESEQSRLKQASRQLQEENRVSQGAIFELQEQILNGSFTQLVIEDNPLQIGFHAMLNGEPEIAAGEHVKPWTVFTNKGQSFNPTTGEFTTPIKGFYFFVASTGAVPSDGFANIQLMKEGVGRVSETWLKKYSGYWNMGSCHATLHLNVKDKVWLQTQHTGTLDFQSTSFSGFLIHPDIN